MKFVNIYATTYYLSNSGSDLNEGTSPTSPWKTISKLNSMMLKIIPGDKILFERSNVFTGQIILDVSGTEDRPILFGAYGIGRNPIISGSIPITDWTVYKGKIFKSNVDINIFNLFSNGEQMTIARYPNSGFLTIKEPLSNPKNGFIDGDLNQSKDYWNGSNVRIRTINWAYEYSQVKNFDRGKITFSNLTFYPTLSGWGYYLDNKLEELDAEREWYFDTVRKKVYFYAPQGDNLNSLSVEGSVYSFGFYSQMEIKNIIFQELEIMNQSESGIYLIGIKSNIQINNCTFSRQIKTGITLLNSSNECNINYCRFFSINGKAIDIIKSKNLIVSNNIFKNIGMIPGYGITGDAFSMCGIVMLASDSVKIYNNYLDSIGHDAINCLGSDNIIEKNLINNTLLLLNDGGAIKCYGEDSKNSTWRNNFISNIPGNLEGTNKKYNGIIAIGIYLDDQSNNMMILNNTIVKCATTGIFIGNGYNNLIRNNVCYNNYSGIKFYQTEATNDNNVSNNIFFGIDEDQYPVIFQTSLNNFVSNKFDSNYYYNSYDNFFQYIQGNKLENLNFNVWKSLSNYTMDKNSKVVFGIEAIYSKLYTNMSDDSTKILLEPDISYRDLNQNNLYGSVILPPWTSRVLLANKDLNGLPDLTIFGGPLDFGNVQNGNESFPRWYYLSAMNLNSPIEIKTPEGFSVSFEYDGEYSENIQVNPINGSVSKIIYVKFNPMSSSVYHNFISNTSRTLNATIKVIGIGN